MKLDLQTLPNDLALSHQIIIDLLSTLDAKERRIENLMYQLQKLQRYQFGRKSERIALEQLLFKYAGLETTAEPEKVERLKEEEKLTEAKPKKSRTKVSDKPTCERSPRTQIVRHKHPHKERCESKYRQVMSTMRIKTSQGQ